jgi:hypothetical protein
MKNPFVQFIIGSVFGALIACTITLHLVTKQVEANTAQAIAAIHDVESKGEHAVTTTQAEWEKVVDIWKRRAESCESKFTLGTVVYEKQELASIPLLGGMASLRLGAGSGTQPALYIPAQVDIYTDRPDVRYQWFDGRTGEAKGVQIARSPSEAK